MANFPSRALYLVAKPPAELAEQIWRLPRADQARPPRMLHITILPFVDLALFPPEFVPVLCDLLRDFEAPAFRVAFDRIVERRSVVLRSSETLIGVQQLQESLMAFLEARDFPFFGKPPDPHMTIQYRRDGKGNEQIDPIGWRVDELLLIESVTGEARHEGHGRWKLS